MKKLVALSALFLAAGCATMPLPRTVCVSPPIQGKRVMVVQEHQRSAPTPVLTAVETRLRSAGAYPVPAPRGWNEPSPPHDFTVEVGMRSEGQQVRVDLRVISNPGQVVVGNGAGTAGYRYVTYHPGPSRSQLEEAAAIAAVSNLLCGTVTIVLLPPPPPPSSSREWTVPGPSWSWGGGGVFSSGRAGTVSGWEVSGGKVRRVWK